MNIPKDKKLSKRKEKLKEKLCAYPGCEVIFFGTGKSKYCPEHRQKKYRAVLDKHIIEERERRRIEENPNQAIKHSYIDAQTLKLVCDVPECCNEFEIKIIKGVYVYPKYCPEHRNEHRRNMFIQKMRERRGSSMQVEEVSEL